MEGCACWYSVCQPLTAFLEISACMLEIANLGVDLTTTRDSCDWDRTGVTCWVNMCVQSSWHVTDWWAIEGEKTIFGENSTVYGTEGGDYSLWKMSAITEIAPLSSSWRQLVHIQSGLILSEHFPLHLGCSPLIFHCWKPSLVWISGINMGSTSNISRV